MDWVKTAKIGDKVVCVDDKPHIGIWFPNEKPIIGCVYTIEDVFVGLSGRTNFAIVELTRHEKAALIIAEKYGVTKIGYAARRFRPVQRRDTDISIFTDMLKKAPAQFEEP